MKQGTNLKDMVRAHVFISGRVQGVCFRAYTQNQAASFKLTGWVKNCSDGSVEAVFEGSREAVEDMVSWCGQGPLGAFVDKVNVQWLEYIGEYDGFGVTY